MSVMAEKGKRDQNVDGDPVQLDGVRVLVIFGGSHLYGQERANLEVFRSLVPLGLKARFLTNRRYGRSIVEPELNRLGFEWRRVRYGYHLGRYLLGPGFYYVFVNLFSLISTTCTVLGEIRRWRPTHIYAPNWLHYFYVWPALIFSKLPLVYRAGDELPTHTWFHRCMTQALFHRSAVLVCNCHFLARKFEAIGLPSFKTRLIYNYPPRRQFSLKFTLPSVTPGATTLAYVGQISKHKGVCLLVDAVIQLISEGRDVFLLIAGKATWNDPIERVLQNKVMEAGMGDRIRFLGFVENIPDFFDIIDCHICPSLWEEPSPNVIFEAKQASVPSVVFPMGGMPEIVEHKVDGYVCPNSTSEGLREGICYFLDRPEKLQVAGRLARQSLDRRFNHKRFVRQWTEVFQSRRKG